MGIVIKDVDGVDRYRIEPYKDTCFQLHKWFDDRVSEKSGRFYKEGDIIPAGWKPIECYPTSLAHAMRKVYEKMLQEDMKTERGFKQAIKHAEDLERRVMSDARVVATSLRDDTEDDSQNE